MLYCFERAKYARYSIRNIDELKGSLLTNQYEQKLTMLQLL